MRKKPEDAKSRTVKRRLDTDTASYGRLQSSPKLRSAADRRDAKMPHERDESAHSSGNRLSETLPPSQREISQAHEDTERGILDTERRGVPNDLPSKTRRSP